MLYTNRNLATSIYDYYVNNFTQSRDSRVATASLSYRLESSQLATNRRAEGAEEKKRRVSRQ